MSSISSVSNLNVVILMEVHLPVHLARHTAALWICGERDRRSLFSSAWKCSAGLRRQRSDWNWGAKGFILFSQSNPNLSDAALSKVSARYGSQEGQWDCLGFWGGVLPQEMTTADHPKLRDARHLRCWCKRRVLP